MKREYKGLVMTPIDVELSEVILGSSVVNNSKIQSTGQEIGAEYDFSDQSFNHEWGSN
ncbi:MAG: hypothetical protein J5732_08835 [Bacteroidaceae bacterium]|nr:hypothetical protein [Bacteroidaceae bacterium]